MVSRDIYTGVDSSRWSWHLVRTCKYGLYIFADGREFFEKKKNKRVKKEKQEGEIIIIIVMSSK